MEVTDDVHKHLPAKFRKSVAQSHCGEPKTQWKWFYDENRDGLDDEIRRNYMPKKNTRLFIREKDHSVD